MVVSRKVCTVTGDSSSNSITLSGLSNGKVRIAGNSSTSINGGSYVDVAASAFSIRLNGGDDTLSTPATSKAPLKIGSLSVSMSSGLDQINANYIQATGAVSFDMGDDSKSSGYEGAALLSSDIGSFSYRAPRSAGANSLALEIVTVRGDVSIEGSSGTNTVNLASLRVTGSISAKLGDEANGSTAGDRMALTNVNVAGKVNINMGSGRAVVTLKQVTADTITIGCGGGDSDSVVIEQTRARLVTVDGGGGKKDKLSGSGNVFARNPTVRNFETNTLSFVTG
ncbi:MAG: hypothetical protein JSS02_05665 [Planctomycetes bacterium]|nr:hypothetical protein [Planctomycetota bacterium]